MQPYNTGAWIRTGNLLVLSQPRLPLAPLQLSTRSEIRTRKTCGLSTGRMPFRHAGVYRRGDLNSQISGTQPVAYAIRLRRQILPVGFEPTAFRV